MLSSRSIYTGLSGTQATYISLLRSDRSTSIMRETKIAMRVVFTTVTGPRGLCELIQPLVCVEIAYVII
eukprot:COSAG01_NODE_1098_length_11703_cov_1483.853844_1_plen_69_part_00